MFPHAAAPSTTQRSWSNATSRWHDTQPQQSSCTDHAITNADSFPIIRSILCRKQSHCCNDICPSWSVASTLCLKIPTLTQSKAKKCSARDSLHSTTRTTDPPISSASDDDDEPDIDYDQEKPAMGLPRHSPHKRREAVSDSVGSLASAVSQAIKEKIPAGEYVDFEKLLAGPWAHDGQASKGSQSKLLKLPISNYGSWSIAFAAQLVSAHLSKGAELFQYMGLIAGVNKNFKPSAWLKYDLAFRRRAAAELYLQWDLADPNIWSLCFTGPDVNLARTVTCFHHGLSRYIATQ